MYGYVEKVSVVVSNCVDKKKKKKKDRDMAEGLLLFSLFRCLSFLFFVFFSFLDIFSLIVFCLFL